MAKVKTVYVCSSCQGTTAKWMGQCPHCQSWDTIQEEVVAQPSKTLRNTGYVGGSSSVMTLDAVDTADMPRFSSSIEEFDRVLGGGLVVGGTVIISGNPGAGKSTILLQSACAISQERKVLYVSGEESLAQISLRADRLGLRKDKLLVVCETDVTAIGAFMERERPSMMIVDSIQVIHHPGIDSLPGGVTQVRECASYLNQTAKRLGVTLFLVGHITKSESMAGPMSLSHIVDTVLMLSSTEDARYRIIRVEKNRFGNVAEIGVFAMTEKGMQEVLNPSAIFLSRAIENIHGSVITPLWEGSRPMLVEMQALVDDSLLSNPRRVSVGIDGNRASMLLAVLHRHGGLVIADKDIYLNVVGGVRITETSSDLAVLMAVASSFREKVVNPETIIFGEVGLSGEIRPCANGQERLKEASKLGFKTALVPHGNLPQEDIRGMTILPVRVLADAIEWMETL